MPAEGDGILTLEPLIEAVRDGVEAVGWTLSGMQKTTSHQFEGRWEGEETRSAYLFFHDRGARESVSIDVYLDETPRGLKGNLALVLDGRGPDETGPVESVLDRLGDVATAVLPEGYRTPVSLRYRRSRPGSPAENISVEVRVKLTIPATAIGAGASAVSALCSATVHAFERLMDRHELRSLASIE